MVEPFLARFGTGTGAEACGHVEVTSPAIKLGNNNNVQEVPVGKPTTLSSKVEGADALATSWKIVRKGAGGKIESEETVHSSEYLGEATTLPYTFSHTGEYEITETVTTDNLGTPTKQAREKGDGQPAGDHLQGRSQRGTARGWTASRDARRIPRQGRRPQRS